VLADFDETVIGTYRPAERAVFRKTNEHFGGLSNMSADFPLWVNGFEIRTSEAIHHAARFPHLPDVQRDIVDQASPMAAKMKGKPHRRNSRPDFDASRVPIMWWALRVKLACNPVRVSHLLGSTGEKDIVEDSHKDTYWGAVALKDNPTRLRGANVLGRLLIALRDVVDTFDQSVWQVVPPPTIPDFTSSVILSGSPTAHASIAATIVRPRRHDPPSGVTSAKTPQKVENSVNCARRALSHCLPAATATTAT
jgi:type I restriction enzyme S subunit